MDISILRRLAAIATICLIHPQASQASELSLFGGVSGGFTHIIPAKGEGTSKNGYHLLLSGFAELSHDEWVGQIGGGFFYNRVYSDGEKDFEGSQPETVKKQLNLRIETRAGEAGVGVRRKLGLGLEAGLLIRSLFGTSLSFSQDKDSKSTKFFIGPHVVARFQLLPDWLQRAELYLGTDLNVPDKRVYLLSAGIALGTSISSWEARAKAAPGAEERFEEILADKVINFPTASSELQGPALLFLQELGSFLKANPELWKQIEIEGHTDKKGRLAYNMQLSNDRAETVKRILKAQGLDASRIRAQGFGPTRPLMEGDSPEALAANRRVILAFNVNGLSQRNRLSTAIKELRKKHFNE